MSAGHITILGGGPAGLAAGYYAAKLGMPFTIYEARADLGGNARTIQHGEFRFDTGAHRFHDQDPEITHEVQQLLGAELVPVTAPSHIHYGRKLIAFPISTRGLLTSLSIPVLMKIGVELIAARFQRADSTGNFERTAVKMYGPTIARHFLLNYSEKLWGLPAAQLSVKISGKRLNALSAFALLKEALFGVEAQSGHLEGKFYYPRRGYGAIAEALAHACGDSNIRTNCPIQTVHHNQARIEAITTASGARITVEEVVNTIPLTLLVSMLDPIPPAEILAAAKSLRFRNLVIVAIFLDQDRATQSASIYFPDKAIPFTRISEPIQRSPFMAPAGNTSLCVEYPCFSTDRIWQSNNDELVRLTTDHLEQLALIRRERVIDARVIRLPHAYPVLEAGIEDKVELLLQYLMRFSNLRMIGRNGRFVYSHVHDMLRFGLDVINDIAGDRGVMRPAAASPSDVTRERDPNGV